MCGMLEFRQKARGDGAAGGLLVVSVLLLWACGQPTGSLVLHEAQYLCLPTPVKDTRPYILLSYAVSARKGSSMTTPVCPCREGAVCLWRKETLADHGHEAPGGDPKASMVMVGWVPWGVCRVSGQ